MPLLLPSFALAFLAAMLLLLDMLVTVRAFCVGTFAASILIGLATISLAKCRLLLIDAPRADAKSSPMARISSLWPRTSHRSVPYVAFAVFAFYGWQIIYADTSPPAINAPVDGCKKNRHKTSLPFCDVSSAKSALLVPLPSDVAVFDVGDTSPCRQCRITCLLCCDVFSSALCPTLPSTIVAAGDILAAYRPFPRSEMARLAIVCAGTLSHIALRLASICRLSQLWRSSRA